jgi:hypothetical protein
MSAKTKPPDLGSLKSFVSEPRTGARSSHGLSRNTLRTPRARGTPAEGFPLPDRACERQNGRTLKVMSSGCNELADA